MKMIMMIMSMLMSIAMITVITMIMAMTIMKKLLQCIWWLQLQLMDDDSDASNDSDISHGNNDEVITVEWRAGSDDDGWQWL